jgi:uncharacterized protein (TIGR03437 family)
MKQIVWFLFLGLQLLQADTSNIRAVNAASFVDGTSLAPGALISIFGQDLANTTAMAPDLSNLPHMLGGVTVTIRGTALPLFYVTPAQINARIDPSISVGPATLNVTSPTGTFTKDIVLAASSIPGLFSLFGTGTRDGAIQNAVTFELGPFTVTTRGKPTFLAIYTNGLDLSSAPTVTIGGISIPVQFYGSAPCCPELQQVNVQLTPALAGAGRVEVAVTSGGKTSNIVEVVILPSPGQGAYSPVAENQSRSREIAGIAYVPHTNLALLTDENDDVIRVIDIRQQVVTRTITLPEGAQPVALAVNDPGMVAVVAERNRGKVAILDIPDGVVSAEIAVGSGPSSVAIAGTVALVANQDSDTVSLIDLNSMQVTTIAVGRGPRGVAADTNTSKVYVTNQDDGTISVIDLTNLLAAPATIALPPNSRPGAIQLVPALGFAVVTVESASSSAQALIITLSSGSAGAVLVNPSRDGGAGQIAVYANTIYFADQSGGMVSVSPMQNNGSFTTSAVKVDLGARALAVDTTDKLLLVANEGSGTVALIDMTINQIVNRINAVRSEHETNGQDHNNHNDRLAAQNAPAITSISQSAASRPSTFTLTIDGTNLKGADDVFFVDPATLPGKAGSPSHGDSGEAGHGPFGARDTNITASNIQVNGAGTQLTVTITIGVRASAGQRVVRVEALNGDTSFVASPVNTFLVN